MARNTGNEFNIILGADIDETQLRKKLDEIHQITQNGKPVKINVEIEAGAAESVIKDVKKELTTLKDLFKNVDLNIDDSKAKAYEQSLKNQEVNLRELNKALQERNRIQTEITKLENSKTYNTQAQQASISAQRELLEIEGKRIDSLSAELSGTEKAEAATRAKEKADLQLDAAQQKVASSSKQNVGFLQNMVTGLKEATARIFDYTIAYRAITGIGQILRESISTAKELDKTLVDLQIVTGKTRQEANELLQTYNALGKELGATTQQVAESANDFLRQGLSMEETNKMIESSMYLSKLGMIDSADATQYLTSATKGYKLSADDAMGVVDKLVTVDMNAAVSSGYLAEAMARTSNSAREAGVEMDTLIGYIATIGETTQKSASTVGESLKTMFARFGNVKAGAFAADGEDMENLNDIETVFKSLGIQIRETSGTMRDFDDVLADVAKSWDTFNDIERGAIATAAAGVRHRENFLVLMDNYDQALKLESDSLNSAGTASEKYRAYQESLEASLASLTASFEQFVMSLNTSGIVKFFVDAGAGILDFLSKTNLLQTALGLLAIRFAVLGITKFASWLKTTGQQIKVYTNLLNNLKDKTGQARASILLQEDSLVGLSNKQKENILLNKQSISAIGNLTKSRLVDQLQIAGLNRAEAEELATKIKLKAATSQNVAGNYADATSKGVATAATFSFKGAMEALKASLMTHPIMWIAAVIAGVVAAFSALGNASKDAKEDLDEMKGSLQELQNESDAVQLELDEIEKQIEELKKKSDRTAEENKNLEALELQKNELKEQLDYKQKLIDLDSNDVAMKGLDAIFKTWNATDFGFDFDDLDHQINIFQALVYDIASAFSEASGGLDDNLEKLKEANSIQQELNNSTDEYNNLIIKEKEGTLTSDEKNRLTEIRDMQKEVNDLFSKGKEQFALLEEMLDGIDYSGLTEENKQLYDVIFNMLDQAKLEIYKFADPENYNKLYLQELIDDTGLRDELSELKNEVGENPITADDILQIDGMQEILDRAGVSAEDFANQLNEDMQTVRNSLEETEGLFSSVAEEIHNAFANMDFSSSIDNVNYLNEAMNDLADNVLNVGTQMDILTTAQEEMNSVGTISANTLKAMTENNLLGYLTDLANGSFDAAVAQSELTNRTQEAAVAAIYDSGMKQIESVMAKEVGTSSANAVSGISNVGTASANAGVKAAESGNKAAAGAEGWIRFWSALENNPDYQGLSPAAVSEINKIKQDTENAVKMVGNIFSNIQYTSSSSSGYGGKSSSGSKKSSGSKSGSKSGSGSSSSKTDNTDYWKQAFDAEYATLKHNRDMDIISEKEYLEQLDALNQKYFAGRAKYLDEYRKYEEEVYKGRKKELEEQQKAEIEAAKAVYEAQKDAIKKQQDNLKDQLDAYKKIIDKRKELLSTMKEEKSYQDELTDKNNSILDLENRIAELRYDTSAEGTKKRLELEDELAKKVKEKEDYMYDHSVTAQQDALDKEYDNYAEFIDDAISKLDESLDRLEQAFEATTKAIEAQFKALIDALNDNAVDGGVGAGGGGFGFGIQNLSGQRGDAVKQAQQQLNDQYGGGLNVDGIWGSKTQAAYVRAVQKYLNDNFGAGLAVDGIWGSKTQAAWESAGGGAKPFHKGIEEGFVGGVEGNEMFAKLLNGELVTNEGQQNRFMDKILPQLLGNTAQAVTETISNGVNIDMDFNVAGNMDESVIPQVRNAVKEIIETYFIRGQKRNVRAFSI